MQKLLLPLLLLLALLPAAHAQIGFNSPAGVTPSRDAEIYSRDAFVVQQKYLPTSDPISGTFTMSCAAFAPWLTATAGVLLDPGGTSNYPASLTCTQYIISANTSLSNGYELTFNQFGTEANGDSVVIEDYYGGRIAFSGNALPPVLLVPGYQVAITFKADNDGNVGSGFVLSWRQVIMVPSPTGGGDNRFGKALQFDLTKAALVSGLSGVGALFQAGDYSTALGLANKAIGDYSSAVGSYNTVSGQYSNAIGRMNKVGGNFSTALGSDNTVNGTGSTAIGNYGSTAGYQGAMILSDYSVFTSVSATANNQLTARFAGGYRFFTNSFLTTGVSLAAGGTSWATISDSTKKERFLPINGPALLQKISGMKLTTWNYKGQRDRRHYGPMAQEFFALFGQDALGEIGCDTLITTQDMEGLTLSAVQALVKENEQLKNRLTQTETTLQQTNARLALLEQALLGRKRVTMRKTKP
jgi:hypothetical protein